MTLSPELQERLIALVQEMSSLRADRNYDSSHYKEACAILAELRVDSDAGIAEKIAQEHWDGQSSLQETLRKTLMLGRSLAGEGK